jgi:signal transduction histidine kinase
MPSLRIAHKLLLALVATLVVVAALAGWSLLVTRRLVEENRAIASTAIPAVRLEVTLLETAGALRRIEARYLVLRDPVYLELFRERARGAEGDLARLDTLLSTPAEQDSLRGARTSLAAYRAAVGRDPAGRGEHPAVALEAALDRLYQESAGELRRRQAGTEALVAQSRLVASLGVAVAGLVGVGLAVFVVIGIVRPLRRLEAATRDVATREFAGPIPVRGQDEIAGLTRAFNHMAARLAELDRLREQLFSAVSHDLRTPLAAIRGSAELLQMTGPGALTAKQARLVRNIDTSSRRMLALVNQILDLGRLRAGRLQLDLQPTDLGRLIAGALDEVRPLAEAASIRLDSAGAEGLPPVAADGAGVRRILANLLGNALRFTPAGGRVTVRVEVEDHQVAITVADTGIGIPRHLLSTVFDPYQQAHAGRGGTGIGLAVVRSLVEAHGGRVWVDAEEGRGSRFTFTLPRPARAA